MAQPKDRRRALLARVHIAKKEMALDDDAYRDAVEARFPGVRSAGKLSVAELGDLLDHFKTKGWAGTRKPAAKSPSVRKVYALWGILHAQGRVKASSPDGFVRRHTKTSRRPEGLGSTNWLSDDEAYTVIEALKKWIAREGLSGHLR